MSPHARPLVDFRQVGRTFGSVEALSPCDLSVHRGEFVSLIGPSGCGKSTLLRLASRLDAPTTGTVEFTDPARDNAVVGRYPISVTTDAGNRVTGLIADRQMVVSEAFGRAICDAAFGRNPRRPGPQNATGG